MFEEVIKLMDNDTLLILASDHGQVMEGTHGGNSDEESSSFIFGYTKRGFAEQIRDPKYKSILSRSQKTLY